MIRSDEGEDRKEEENEQAKEGGRSHNRRWRRRKKKKRGGGGGEWEESALKTPSRETSLEGFKEDDSSYKRAPRDGQWQSAFKIAVSSPCSTKNKMSDLWENSTAKVYNRQVYSDFTSRRRLHWLIYQDGKRNWVRKYICLALQFIYPFKISKSATQAVPRSIFNLLSQLHLLHATFSASIS